MFFVG